MINGAEPPRDAEGREIPLDTKVLYTLDGNRFDVLKFDYWSYLERWCVYGDGKKFTASYSVSDVLLSPPDSWEQLERDAALAPRDYLQARGIVERRDGRIAAMMADLVSRAKALAGRGNDD